MKLKKMMKYLLLVTAGLAPAAHSQSPDNLRSAVTEGSQFDQALRDINSQSAVSRDGEVIDGEGGVFLLQKADIFRVGVDTAVGYQDNPARTDVDSDGSMVASVGFFGGVATTLGNGYNLGANLNLNYSEVESASELSNRSAVLSLYGGRGVLNDRINLVLNGYYGTNMSSSFSSDSKFYGASLSASTLFSFGQTKVLRPVLSVGRQLSDNDEQHNWSYSARVDAIWQFRPRWRTDASVAYTHRTYDDFFENVTLTERKDKGTTARVGISYLLTPASDFTLSAGYGKQRSTFFLSQYEASDVEFTANFSMRF